MKSLAYVEIDIPDFIPTQVLLNFENANSPAGDIEDENTKGGNHTWAFVGNAFLDTAEKKFGSASLKCDGTGDYITTPDSDDFTLGSADFTIDLWFNRNGGDGTFRGMFGQANAAGNTSTRTVSLYLSSSNTVQAGIVIGGVAILVAGTTTITTTGWHHAAIVRTGDIAKLFVDGVQEGGDVTITGSIQDSDNNFSVGNEGERTTLNWFGWIDAFRFSAGVARWTSNFTPPISADDAITTFRFAIDTDYLPNDIPCIPSIKDVQITPAIISLGENLGQRASVAVAFKDHRHVFIREAFDSGTFWGKFRARYGLTLTGFSLRVIRGALGDQLENMETRHYVIESTDGPSADGEYKIIAKDVLKLADGDRAQAPVPSNGFLLAAITSGGSSFTLSPSGIGNLEYPASGHVNIGGKEIVAFTRAADVMTITRAQFNTTAVAHDAGERAQLCLRYLAQDVADIIADLLLNYTDVDSDWVPLAAWQTETGAYLGNVYSALIAEPTAVNKLISELVEQAGLAVWWNDINQTINLQVLRPIASDAAIYNADNYLMDSLEVKEQPEKRLSQVYTYFAKLNPLINEDQINNYRSTAYTTDTDAQAEYGDIPAIKKIFSRWIPDGGRAVADLLNLVLLARFRDPPRRISFDILRGSGVAPFLGVGYLIEGWPFQELDGAAAQIPVQITRLNPRADTFKIEAEEISLFGAEGASSPDVHTLIIDSNLFNVNLRTMHDSIYGTPQSGQTVNVTVAAGVKVGSTGTGTVAMTVGDWPAGITINLTNNGRIQGKGGGGATGGFFSGVPGDVSRAGSPGGTALYTRYAINLNNTSGQIWGGGGGGASRTVTDQGGGGGGAGTNPGAGGPSENPASGGAAGTSEAGGEGGPIGSSPIGKGATGGGPGLAGGTLSGPNGAGGAAGAAIDGITLGPVTNLGTGDRRGGQIN